MDELNRVGIVTAKTPIRTKGLHQHTEDHTRIDAAADSDQVASVTSEYVVEMDESGEDCRVFGFHFGLRLRHSRSFRVGTRKQ